MFKRNKLARRKLDEVISGSGFSMLKIPNHGWIKTVRQALGMTTSQFAQRLGVKQPRVFEIEKDETKLSIKNLEKAAAALGCDLAYMFIPKNNKLDCGLSQQGLEQIVHMQARNKAKKIIEKTTHNMALENQTPVYNEKEFEDIVNDLLHGSPARLWDENE